MITLNLGKRLKEARKTASYTLADVESKTGISNGYLSQLERNKKNNPSHSLLQKLADLYSVSMFHLLSGSFEPIETENVLVKLPILEKIAVGLPILAEENIVGYKETILNKFNYNEYFYLKIRGDSMIKIHIDDGDLVLIRRQVCIENGQLAVVIVNGETSLKKVYKNDRILFLQSANSRFEPIIIEKEKVRIIGRAIEVRKLL